jgi:hypothetical protein
MRSFIVTLIRAGQRPSWTDGIPPLVADALRSWRLADLLFSPIPAIAGNRALPE